VLPKKKSRSGKKKRAVVSYDVWQPYMMHGGEASALQCILLDLITVKQYWDG
jgi:hypothetical protein